MIAEEFNYYQKPKTSIPKGKTVSYIISMIKQTPTFFISALTNPSLIKPLNENKLTQIFVEQINAILLENELSILAQTEYSDLFFGAKGIPDFYFHSVEKGQTNKPLFVVESKILPSPSIDREKEYVTGNNKNGGIERYKIEKHGKCFSQCGIIGFVKNESFEYWINKVNKWIKTLALSDSFWNSDEILNQLEINSDSAYLKSVAHRISSEDIRLHHFWIITPT